MHSTTKFLNGHSDGLGGVLVATTPQHKESFEFVQKCTGGILSPFECFLVLRGVKTLAVRMKQHEVNGYAIANYLVGHAKVPQVYYPGLPQHPQHALAQRQMSGFRCADHVLKPVRWTTPMRCCAGSGYARSGNRWVG